MLWRSRRWRYLLSRIDHLPRNSAYVEAVSLDEEVAQAALDRPAPKGNTVRMRDWSPMMEAIVAQVDRLGDVIQAVIAAQGGKPPQIAPFPRPKTAADKLRDPHREHHRILTKVMIQQADGSVLPADEASMTGALL